MDNIKLNYDDSDNTFNIEELKSNTKTLEFINNFKVIISCNTFINLLEKEKKLILKHYKIDDFSYYSDSLKLDPLFLYLSDSELVYLFKQNYSLVNHENFKIEIDNINNIKPEVINLLLPLFEIKNNSYKKLFLIYINYIKKDINTDKKFDISKEFKSYHDIVRFIYKYKLDWVIEYYNLTNRLNKISPELEKEIGQNYLNSHSIDDEIVKMLSTSKGEKYQINTYARKYNLDIEYIINNIKYYNKFTLHLLNSSIYGNSIYGRYRNTDNIKDRCIVNDENTKIFKLLSAKYAKYLLNNDIEAKFISEYFENKKEEEDKEA